MPKRGREGAAKSSKAKRRAIERYGADAVRKYYSPLSGRSRKLVGQRETGYFDYGSAVNMPFDTTGSIFLAASVTQGSGIQQRVGKRIMWKSLQVRGQIIANAAAVYNDCAMLVVYDKRPTGSLPAITDILQFATAASMNNDDNSGRFVILKRKDFRLVGSSSTPTSQSSIGCDFYLKINRPAVFKSAGTGAIGDISEGALYVISVGSNAAGTSAAASNLAFRVRFVDMP